MGCSRAVEDDVAISALGSVCRGLQEGRFPGLADRDGPWRLLVWITVRKSIDRNRRERSRRPHGVKELAEADLIASQEEHPSHVLDRIASDEIPPEMAAIGAEEPRIGIESLGDQSLVPLPELRMANSSTDEIAQRLGRSPRTIQLKLKLIREKWRAQLDA
ncbi:MAG: ECF-type sigma factor [Isosphaeraceae bacterium]